MKFPEWFMAWSVTMEGSINEDNISTVDLPGYIISEYYVTFFTKDIDKH